jgi:uncharacterized protein (TIGR03437 family)
MLLGAQTPGPVLRVDAGRDRHPISPLIYGLDEFDDQNLDVEARYTVRRWGGNSTSRFNWKTNSYNAAADWYFGNFPWGATPGPLPENSGFNRLFDLARRQGSMVVQTLPAVGWLPRDQSRICSFSVRKYGAQQQVDPYNSDCGNGKLPNGRDLTGNDPNDASSPAGAPFSREWIEYLKPRNGTAQRGGTRVYAVDNEPTIWMWTHRDVHPEWVGYDEMRDKGIAYARAVKEADPKAEVAGPVLHGWMAFFHSAKDWQAGWSTGPNYRYWSNPVDRRAHGDIPFTDWYLQQMKTESERVGVRLLDYLDLHAYTLPDNLAFEPAGDLAKQRLRLESTRALWDPTYKFQSGEVCPGGINDAACESVRLVPRMRELVARNYPGTRTAITEYNWGALDHINGALAQADILGIFGREGLDLATIWGPPKPGQPGSFAFRIFRNYDGKGGTFGETGVLAASQDSGKLSVYAAERSDSALTVLVVNKALEPLTSRLEVSGFTGSDKAEVWRYSDADLTKIVRLADEPVQGAAVAMAFPSNSITLLVLPKAERALLVPRPTVAAVQNAASYGGIAPGTIAVLFGTGMGPETIRFAAADADAMVPAELDGVRVLFNGTPAPVVYARQDQVAAMVPYTAALKPAAWVQVEYRGSRSDGIEVPVLAAAPGIFTSDASGRGQAAVLNETGSANSVASPAALGSVLQIFATGEGETTPYGVDGKIANDGILPRPRGTVRVEIGGVRVTPEYAGAAPGAAAGLFQVNARIPAGVVGDRVPVRIWIGDSASPEGVTVAVR